MDFDLDQTDALLATTRSVRKRLDLTRPVPTDVLLDCIRLAVQAPTGGNAQTWRWLVVDDAETKAALAELYARDGRGYLGSYQRDALDGQTNRVLDSADFLLEVLDQVPAMVIPCMKGRLTDTQPIVASSMLSVRCWPLPLVTLPSSAAVIAWAAVSAVTLSHAIDWIMSWCTLTAWASRSSSRAEVAITGSPSRMTRSATLREKFWAASSRLLSRAVWATTCPASFTSTMRPRSAPRRPTA